MSDASATGHLTRQQLYEQVWSTPMRKLALRYGLSDVELATLCQRHDIPRPPRGYWAKQQFGQAPPRIRLPQPANDYDIRLHEVSAEVREPVTDNTRDGWITRAITWSDQSCLHARPSHGHGVSGVQPMHQVDAARSPEHHDFIFYYTAAVMRVIIAFVRRIVAGSGLFSVTRRYFPTIGTSRVGQRDFEVQSHEQDRVVTDPSFLSLTLDYPVLDRLSWIRFRGRTECPSVWHARLFPDKAVCDASGEGLRLLSEPHRLWDVFCVPALVP